MDGSIKAACEKFALLLEEQLARVDEIKKQEDFIDYSKLGKIVIGVCHGDGIGPEITKGASGVLELLLEDEVKAGRVEFRPVEGLTLENRVRKGQSIPDEAMAQLKSCHAILKGPTTTPQKGDGRPNLESANVAMRKALDLFANIRPVRSPSEGIDWTLFRENTEGAYAAGSSGFNVTDDLAVDFTITTAQGSERIARIAYEYAHKRGYGRVSIVTKANVIKTTDGNFLEDCRKIGALYPDITTDEWYADILAAKLIDPKRRRDFKVMILPNLYGDIISDEAAEFQGGVGTAGAANIGKRYAMFEAIHGSAPRMVEEGRARYADPCSMLRAASLLLSHIGYGNKAALLDEALDFCMLEDRKLRITGRADGATCAEYARYVADNIGVGTARRKDGCAND